MTTSRSIGAIAAAGALLMAACSGGDDAAEDTTPATAATAATTTTPPTTVDVTTTSSTTSTSTSTTTTTLAPVVRQPLAGDAISDESEITDRPALAVKIDNHPSARPNHSGLAVADIVFEEIVEGQLSRFLAIFHSTGSDRVGPIRSGREQDVALLTSFDLPLFAWSGGNPGVTRLIADSAVVDLNAVRGGRGYFRGLGSTPHNLYNDTESLWAQTPEDHPGAPPQQFRYLRPEESFVGEPVDSVNVLVGSTLAVWVWDAELAQWVRYQNGTPHFDVSNGQVTSTNVVVMSVPYGRSAIDTSSPEAKTVGSGAVYVFSQGQLVQGEWERQSMDSPIEFFDEDGDPLLLTPGNTWIELASEPAPVEWFPGA